MNLLIKLFKKEKKAIIIGLSIIILGFLLRLYKLTNLPVFGDEAIYIRWAQIMINEPTMRFIPLSDGKQPLFMWFVMPFLKLLNDPLFAGRMVSVLTGIATSIGVFVLTYLFSKNKKTSLIAFFIYTIIPFSIFFERLAMADSMLSMFGIWSLILFTLIIQYKRLDLVMLFGFILSGALLTKSPALYFVLLLPLSVVVDFLKNNKMKLPMFTHGVSSPPCFLESKIPPKPSQTRRRGMKNTIIYVVLLGFAYCIAYGIYNFILHLGPNFHMIALRNKDYIFPFSHLWENPRDPFIFHFDRALEWFMLYGTWPLSVLFVVGLLRGLKEKTFETIILISWFIIPLFASSMFARTFTTRYVFYILPYYVVIASLVFIDNLKLKKIVKILSTTLILFTALISFKFYFVYTSNVEKTPLAETDRSGFLVEWTAGKGIKEISQIIIDTQIKNPNRKIVVGTEGYFGTLPDGLQMYLSRYPQITVIGVGIDLNQMPVQLTESKKAGNLTYLVINSSRLKMEINNSDFRLLSSYQKSARNPKSHEYALHGPSDKLYLLEVL